jgi:hypothetical protein
VKQSAKLVIKSFSQRQTLMSPPGLEVDMRKLITGMRISVDGKIEGPEGYADWVEAWSRTCLSPIIHRPSLRAVESKNCREV